MVSLPGLQRHLRKAENVAREILTLSEKQLGPAVTKLRNIFVDDLTIAATVGECPECLYAVMIALSEMWWTDTELIEGANNIIKMLGKISPSIRHRLTSARFLIKQAICEVI